MNSKDYRNLQEAYLDVYEQEITLKETGPRLVDPHADPDDSKSGGKMKGPKMKNVIKKEETEIYDIILSHLLDEGYADTQEAAERIMVNMSEDWRESIVEQGLDPDAPGNTHSLADLHNALKKYEDKKNAAKSPKPGGSGSAGKVKENNK